MPSPALIAASTRPMILSILLHRRQSYGYEIIQLVKQHSGGFLEWSDGMLYPVLHRLEKEELIRSHWDLAENGRKRKYYRLEEKGRLELETAKEQWFRVHETLTSIWNLEQGLVSPQTT